MGLFDVVGGIVALPVAVASDAVKTANGSLLFDEDQKSDTKKVVENIVESTKKEDGK